HRPGHICLYDEERKVLFSGDHVLVGITPHISPSHLTSYNQLGQYLDALRRVQYLNADIVLPAHERPFDRLAHRVGEILEHRIRLQEVLDALSDGPMSPWRLAMKVTWDVGSWAEMEPSNRVLAMRETVAHLQLLESRGQVTMVETDGTRLFALRGTSSPS
ncbi:MAG: MBL fold metallo-hydrolase, partial [Chloroflexi bacterium]|nr:MBL fold metallo-hydrolase [Chloroflexota bacterium]